MSLPALSYSAGAPIAAPAEPFRFTSGEIRVFRIPEKISTAEWAERHRTVVDGGRKSPWRNELSPCAVGIMNALDLPYVREVYVQAPPQTVKTQTIINYLMRCIDQRPTSAMLVMPDEKLTKRIMRRRIVPSVKATPRTAAVISPRADDTTNLSVAFMNGMDIIGAWAGSPSSLSSDAMELMILDEMNKYPPPTGAEPNAFVLARARTNSFPFTHKIYGGSSSRKRGVFLPADVAQVFGVEFFDANVCRRWVIHHLHPHGEHCPNCGSRVPEKFLTRFHSGDRLKCNCGKFFTALTGTFLSGCQLDAREVILLAILLFLGVGDKIIAEFLKISPTNVHLWRQKFRALNRLRNEETGVKYPP